MKAYRRKEKEEGVSPVIATILMVAITVVLAATLYLMVGNMGNQNNNVTPPIQFNAKKVTAHSWTLEVSASNLRPIDLKYAIQSSNGGYVKNTTANKELIGIDFPTQSGQTDSYGVTWYDANNNNKVDTGDTITIDDNDVNSGDTFTITAGATGSVTLP